jgi:small conductance mechanosensitive channel
MEANMLANWINANGIPIVIIFVGAFLVNRFGAITIAAIIRRTVGRLQNDISEGDIHKRQTTLISISKTFLHVLVWLVVGFSILRRFGIDLTPLLAGASVLGVAIGFGAQSLIKDFLSGLFIVLENQYRVGDVVELGENSSGTVEQITVRSTTLRDQDGNVHYVPNGSITRTINKTMGFSKINLLISVAPGTNVDNLSSIINEIGEKMKHEDKWKDKILEAPHFLNIGSFTKTALEIKIIGKTQPSEQWGVTGELRKRLLAAFKKHHIDSAPS